MKSPPERLLFWTPRILCLLFAAFLGLFALDVFGEGYGFRKTVFALLMHLIPTGVLLAALAISWRRERVGGLLFLGLGAYYLLAYRGRFHWSAYLVISGPLFLIGLLFLLDGWYRARLRTDESAGGATRGGDPQDIR